MEVSGKLHELTIHLREQRPSYPEEIKLDRSRAILDVIEKMKIIDRASNCNLLSR
jgi:hypothetical protein